MARAFLILGDAAPTELVILRGRRFYKDVAPLALGNGGARQSSARRASATKNGEQGSQRSRTASEGKAFHEPGRRAPSRHESTDISQRAEAVLGAPIIEPRHSAFAARRPFLYLHIAMFETIHAQLPAATEKLKHLRGFL
jgi:hypothetical protein